MNRERRLAAKRALARPAVVFSGVQALCISQGFARYAKSADLAILACAILPDHVHVVLGAHRLAVPQLVIQLKGEATYRLAAEGLHPFQGRAAAGERPPKCFARGQWKVYLDTVEDVQRAIQYVEDNPVKEGKRRQRWGFVTAWGSAPLPRRG